MSKLTKVIDKIADHRLLIANTINLIVLTGAALLAFTPYQAIGEALIVLALIVSFSFLASAIYYWFSVRR